MNDTEREGHVSGDNSECVARIHGCGFDRYCWSVPSGAWNCIRCNTTVGVFLNSLACREKGTTLRNQLCLSSCCVVCTLPTVQDGPGYRSTRNSVISSQLTLCM